MGHHTAVPAGAAGAGSDRKGWALPRAHHTHVCHGALQGQPPELEPLGCSLAVRSGPPGRCPPQGQQPLYSEGWATSPGSSRGLWEMTSSAWTFSRALWCSFPGCLGGSFVADLLRCRLLCPLRLACACKTTAVTENLEGPENCEQNSCEQWPPFSVDIAQPSRLLAPWPAGAGTIEEKVPCLRRKQFQPQFEASICPVSAQDLLPNNMRTEVS